MKRRREFITVLGGVLCRRRHFRLSRVDGVNMLHSSSVLTVVALAARAEFLFRIALIELA